MTNGKSAVEAIIATMQESNAPKNKPRNTHIEYLISLFSGVDCIWLLFINLFLYFIKESLMTPYFNHTPIIPKIAIAIE